MAMIVEPTSKYMIRFNQDNGTDLPLEGFSLSRQLEKTEQKIVEAFNGNMQTNSDGVIPYFNMVGVQLTKVEIIENATGDVIYSSNHWGYVENTFATFNDYLKMMDVEIRLAPVITGV